MMSLITKLINEGYNVEDINSILIHKEKLSPEERKQEWAIAQHSKQGKAVRDFLVLELNTMLRISGKI